jgi:hypothetical protein
MYEEDEGEKTIKSDGRKLLLDALKLIGISGSDRFPYYRGIFQPGSDYREIYYIQTL